jgi:hypothetical protein
MKNNFSVLDADKSWVLNEETEIVFHEHDPKIDTIRIKMPKVEEWYSKVLEREVSREEALTYVDGFNLPIKDQKFRHAVVPEKISAIWMVVSQKTGKKIDQITTDDVYQEIDNNPFYYEDEIKWLKTQIKRRFYGYWFYKKGKPTYMNGWAYMFFNFWKIENDGRNESKPDYRDFHRRVFHALEWCYTTTEAVFKHKVMWMENDKPKAKYFNSYDSLMSYCASLSAKNINYVKETNGNFIVDLGKRTVLGGNFFKARRHGLTAVLNCAQYCVATEAPNRNTTVSGLTDESVGELFKNKIVPVIDAIPFFMSPARSRENQSVAHRVVFDYKPAQKALWKAGQLPAPINSSIRVIGNHHTAVDGTRQYFMTKDEFLKVPSGKGRSEINEWLAVASKCLMDGGTRFIGLMALASTVPKMKEGGSDGKVLADRSHYNQRTDNGYTLSGQVNFFLSAYEGQPGFIDEYGDDVIDDPSEETFDLDGNQIKLGSRTFFDNTIKALEEAGDIKGVIDQKHLYPRFYEEVWEEDTEDNGFPIIRMANRVKSLRENPYSGYKRGDFEWTNGTWSKVVFVDNPESGKWYVSLHLPAAVHSKFYLDPSTQNLAPDPQLMGKFYMGSDPFRFNKANHSGGKKSKGSHAIFYAYDPLRDHEEVPRDKWVSNKWIASYNNYCEDVEEYGWDGIKAMLHFSAMAYPEISEPNFLQFLQRMKMHNFLLYNMSYDGELAKVPGVHATEANKQDMLKDVMTHFNQNIDYENHPEIIEDFMRLRGIDDLTNRDLAAGSGWALKGSKSQHVTFLKEQEEQVFLDSILPTWRV